MSQISAYSRLTTSGDTNWNLCLQEQRRYPYKNTWQYIINHPNKFIDPQRMPLDPDDKSNPPRRLKLVKPDSYTQTQLAALVSHLNKSYAGQLSDSEQFEFQPLPASVEIPKGTAAKRPVTYGKRHLSPAKTLRVPSEPTRKPTTRAVAPSKKQQRAKRVTNRTNPSTVSWQQPSRLVKGLASNASVESDEDWSGSDDSSSAYSESQAESEDDEDNAVDDNWLRGSSFRADTEEITFTEPFDFEAELFEMAYQDDLVDHSDGEVEQALDGDVSRTTGSESGVRDRPPLALDVNVGEPEEPEGKPRAGLNDGVGSLWMPIVGPKTPFDKQVGDVDPHGVSPRPTLRDNLNRMNSIIMYIQIVKKTQEVIAFLNGRSLLTGIDSTDGFGLPDALEAVMAMEEVKATLRTEKARQHSFGPDLLLSTDP
jgi:hypothetical protein